MVVRTRACHVWLRCACSCQLVRTLPSVPCVRVTARSCHVLLRRCELARTRTGHVLLCRACSCQPVRAMSGCALHLHASSCYVCNAVHGRRLSPGHDRASPLMPSPAMPCVAMPGIVCHVLRCRAGSCQLVRGAMPCYAVRAGGSSPAMSCYATHVRASWFMPCSCQSMRAVPMACCGYSRAMPCHVVHAGTSSSVPCFAMPCVLVPAPSCRGPLCRAC